MKASKHRPTVARVDLDAIAFNVQQVSEHIPSQALKYAVVKANAYGHGVVAVTKKLAPQVDGFCVSNMDEALEIREEGLQHPILILGVVPSETVNLAKEHDIRLTVASLAWLDQLLGQEAELSGLKVHIKVDTGMSRLGFLVRGEHFDGGVEAIAASCALGHLEPEGIFTHFSVADEDDAASEDYTQEQFGLFMRVLEALARRGRTFEIRHCTNSGALARYPEMYLDMVRPGIALYGAGADRDRLGLRPVMTLKSCISTIKIFDPETDISYGRTFRTAHKTRVGVLPIGYADGLFRGLSGCMAVQTDQGPAPILGRICMDMTMVDLTELPDVHVGDTVELFGVRQRADVLADILGTIPYELTCAVSKRVPRLYMENGAVVERSLRLLL